MEKEDEGASLRTQRNNKEQNKILNIDSETSMKENF